MKKNVARKHTVQKKSGKRPGLYKKQETPADFPNGERSGRHYRFHRFGHIPNTNGAGLI